MKRPVHMLFRLTNLNVLSSSLIYSIFNNITSQFHMKHCRWCSKYSICKYSQYLEILNITSAPTTQCHTKTSCHYRKRELILQTNYLHFLSL
jgi:hypothetical protein